MDNIDLLLYRVLISDTHNLSVMTDSKIEPGYLNEASKVKKFY